MKIVEFGIFTIFFNYFFVLSKFKKILTIKK